MKNDMMFPKLYAPLRIRGMEVKNRWVMAPMAVLAADRDVYPTR